MEGDGRIIDLNQTTGVLAPDMNMKGGLSVPSKERVIYRPTERKSLLGLDMLAIEKREAKGHTGFKIPAERSVSTISSIDEDEKSSVEDFGRDSSQGAHIHASRHYRGSNVEVKSYSESTIACEDEGGYTPRSRHGTLHHEGSAPTSSRNSHDTRERQRYDRDESSYSRKDENMRPEKYSSDYGRKRTRHGSRTPGKSDWDDGRWEWEDTPRREDRGHSMSRRHRYPSPSPILRGASPESCLVTPWLGGNAPRSAGRDGGRREFEGTPRREDRGDSVSRRRHSDSCQGSEDGRITSFGDKNF